MYHYYSEISSTPVRMQSSRKQTSNCYEDAMKRNLYVHTYGCMYTLYVYTIQPSGNVNKCHSYGNHHYEGSLKDKQQNLTIVLPNDPDIPHLCIDLKSIIQHTRMTHAHPH
jgi:hypothetical protein